MLNLAVEYARNKYVSDWIIFVEDDIEYQTDWYNKIIDVAKNYYGKSPHGLSYGIFTASPLGIKNDKIQLLLKMVQLQFLVQEQINDFSKCHII